MKFSELAIQTQRSAPSEIRSQGQVYLYRAVVVQLSAAGLSVLAEIFPASSGQE